MPRAERLQAIIGASNPNPSNGFTGAALYLSGSSGQDISSLPSLTRLTGINGTTILQDLALVNLTSGLSVSHSAPQCQEAFRRSEVPESID